MAQSIMQEEDSFKEGRRLEDLSDALEPMTVEQRIFWTRLKAQARAIEDTGIEADFMTGLNRQVLRMNLIMRYPAEPEHYTTEE
jgi:hypothetical protein